SRWNKPGSWTNALTRRTVCDRASTALEPPGPAEPLPSHASVTIIGGGAMGISTAAHLAGRGIGSIWSWNETSSDLDPGLSHWVESGQRSRIRATSCWRNAVSKPTSDSEPSSGSTSAFGSHWDRHPQRQGDGRAHDPWPGEDRHCDLHCWAWSQRIGEMAGVLLPVVPVRRQIRFTGPL